MRHIAFSKYNKVHDTFNKKETLQVTLSDEQLNFLKCMIDEDEDKEEEEEEDQDQVTYERVAYEEEEEDEDEEEKEEEAEEEEISS